MLLLCLSLFFSFFSGFFFFGFMKRIFLGGHHVCMDCCVQLLFAFEQQTSFCSFMTLFLLDERWETDTAETGDQMYFVRVLGSEMEGSVSSHKTHLLS